MALIISNAKRSLGAFLLSALLYLVPSLSGCGSDDQNRGLLDAANQYGALDGSYGPPPCSTDQDCAYNGGMWYCNTTTRDCEPKSQCDTDEDCQKAVGSDWRCTGVDASYGCSLETDGGTPDGSVGDDGGQD